MEALTRQFFELLIRLHQLGVDAPNVLIHISSLLKPQLSQEQIVSLLQSAFKNLPSLIQNATASKLEELFKTSHSFQAEFAFLAEFRELQQILQRISYLQLLHLTNNTIPPGPQILQLEFLQKIQHQFQMWSEERLRNLNNVLQETPLHMERRVLLEIEPEISWDLLHFLIEMLKLPVDELFGFQAWISQLGRQHLVMVVQLLSLTPPTILELKQRLDFTNTISPSTSSLPYGGNHPSNSLPVTSTYNQVPISTNTNTSTPIISTTPTEDMMEITSESNKPSSIAPPSNTNITFPAPPPSSKGTNRSIERPPSKVSIMANSLDNVYQLKITRQAPSKTVYQRILKPYPSVMLVGANSDTANNLFVEASLIRSDSEQALPLCIEGTRIVRISGSIATFKKLKILSTSQQQGTLFRLKFTLKRYVGSVFEQVPTPSVSSNPIEVFSHTLYLTEKQDEMIPPPTILEIIPPVGGSGSRVVILGNNFTDSQKLRLRFGDIDVTSQTTLHETGTLICSLPNVAQKTGRVPVRVSNDGTNFCDSKFFFDFTGK